MTKKKKVRMLGKLVNKSVAGFVRIEFNFEGGSVSKVRSFSISCYRGSMHERNSQLGQQTSLSYFK